MRDPPRWPQAFNLNHTAKLIGIARVHKREVTGRRSGEQGRQYNEDVRNGTDQGDTQGQSYEHGNV